MFRSNSFVNDKVPLSFQCFELTLLAVVLVTATIVGSAQTAGSSSARTEAKPEEKTEVGIASNQNGKPNKETKPPFTLSVTEDQIIGVTLKAQDAPVKEIAAELSKRLRIPIAVSPVIEKHRVTVNFSDLVLEPAMQQLAPQVFIDYEIDMTAGKTPRPLGIFLQGYNEPQPSDSAVVKANSDVIIIEGDTEDTGENDAKDEKDQELKVKFEKGELSVIAKKQPLVVVLYAIANELGVPLQVTEEIVDPISVNIQKASIESALQQLSQNIRLYLRADLMTQERRPLRIVLVGPDKKS